MTINRQEKNFVIEGDEYHTVQLGALEGRRIWLRLAKIMAGPLRTLAAQPTYDSATIIYALTSVVDHLDDQTAEDLYHVFGRNCEVHMRDGDRWPKLEGVVFDNHFAGRYLAMSQWFGQMILFNFAAFFDDGSLGKMKDLLKGAAEKSRSQTASTGTSTASSPMNAHQ